MGQIMQKEEEGKSNEKMFKAAADKSTKLAKDALAAAKKCDSPQVLGCAHFTMSQANLMNGKAAEAIKEAENASNVFKGCSYTEGSSRELRGGRPKCGWCRIRGQAHEIGCRIR